MHEDTATPDWSTARGEQWCAQLSGMEATLTPVDAPLLRALQLGAPVTIAEVGCGGGGTALELLRRAPPGSVVHGFDISPALIARARTRQKPGERAIAFTTADMAVATCEQPYDRLVSRFGVMFFADPPAAFANLLRWLAPGGLFAFAVWGPPAGNPWMTCAREVVGQFVELPRIDPGAPGPFRYADPDTLLALLARAGFTGLELHPWRGSLPVGGRLPPADAARFTLAAFANFAELLARAGDDALTAARRALTARFARHVHGDGVHMDAHVHIVTGARPRS